MGYLEISKQQLIDEIYKLQRQVTELRGIKQQYEWLESELCNHSILLKEIAKASTRLLTITDFSTAISEVLSILGNATKVDRVYIFENYTDNNSGQCFARQRFEWTSGLVGANTNDIAHQRILYNVPILENLYTVLSGGAIYTRLRSEFTEIEKTKFEGHNIFSLMMVPIFVEKEFWGFIGFHDCARERIWSDGEKSAIITMAASIGGAVSRMRAEEELAEEKELYSVTLYSIGDGVITTDTEGKIILMNRRAQELTGWSQEEAILKPISKVFNIIDEKTRKPYENPLQKVLMPRQRAGFENHTILIDKNGDEYFISDTGAVIHDNDNNVIGIVIVFRDITRKLHMEEEVIKAGKIESIGTLAGGIAHDFNNILTAIIGNISLAMMHFKAGNKEKTLDRLVDIEKASLQAKDLTRQLLTFAKGGEPIVTTLTIGKILKDTISFTLSGSNVLGEVFVPDDLWAVEADESQINQVFNNLILNAKQAMPKGGKIQVKAYNIEDGSSAIPVLENRKYIQISIEDEGIGIPEKNLNKIFDPYFTTKPNGSGLGLATAYSIIKRHNGHISVESWEGKGTRFNIYLPASTDIVTEDKVVEEDYSYSGKILIMDDEKAVRDVVGMMLSHIGYDTEYATDGDDALRIYKEHIEYKKPFDAVIMDLTIPGGMGGLDAIKYFTEFDPDVKAIVSSGYSNSAVMANYREYGFSGVIAKPYTIEELGKVLQEIIGKGPVAFETT
ncbi:blue-light-activated protein [Oxobacter pfennigii]|uniref:Stage 0 sporulation protein A homolog n=1 Tax=Oxobacter pfennigii TaxID=36849 RepID=A0A0P8X177_9CLOT|nr:ATP-binding protein [Oxobacter pfennigii]KPU44557.1 blue-light-activated protein [Oxobacter pfennigii]